MRTETIRWKVALAAGIFSAVVIAIFAGLSAWWFWHEQYDVLSMDLTKKPSSRQVKEADEEVRRLAASYLLALPFVAVITAAGAWLVAGKLAAPLTALADAAEGMDAHTLHERLPEPQRMDEIGRLARVLNRVFARLEKKFVQAGRFAADASHELRTPLAIMRGSLEEEIWRDPQGKKTPRFVELLEQNQRLASISDKLLLLARADAGQLVSEAESFSFSDLIHEIIEDVSILAEAKNIRLETGIDSDVMVTGDRFLLRQLVLNLLDNAVHHNFTDGTIEVELKRGQGRPSLIVSNSGEPIPEELQERLFERFFRVNSSRDRQTGGAGLGLSLCQEIALAHGGTLTLQSSDARGTVFCLTL